PGARGAEHKLGGQARSARILFGSGAAKALSCHPARSLCAGPVRWPRALAAGAGPDLAGALAPSAVAPSPCLRTGPSDHAAYFAWAKFAGFIPLTTLIGTHLECPSRDPWPHPQQVSALSRLLRHIDRWSAGARRGPQHLALVERLPPPRGRQRPSARQPAHAE